MKTMIPIPDDITKALWDRVEKIVNEEKNGLHIVRNFGLFIDTHRDQPHVGSFGDDIHRGMCVPTQVDYILEDDAYYNPANGKTLKRHAKHMFVDPQWLADFEVQEMLAGREPRDQSGAMPTSHLRDARAKKYHLWSFRQVVMNHYNAL